MYVIKRAYITGITIAELSTDASVFPKSNRIAYTEHLLQFLKCSTSPPSTHTARQKCISCRSCGEFTASTKAYRCSQCNLKNSPFEGWRLYTLCRFSSLTGDQVFFHVAIASNYRYINFSIILFSSFSFSFNERSRIFSRASYCPHCILFFSYNIQVQTFI